MLEGACHCGAATWRFDGLPETATVCSCTICRRYGVIWAYGWDGSDVHVAGDLQDYVWGDRDIAFRFCPTCGCVVCWRGIEPHEGGRHRIAVNLRLAEPGPVAAIPIRRFDGLDTWEDRPPDGRRVADFWA